MKNLLLILAICLVNHHVVAQTNLRLSKGKMETRDPISHIWAGWPNTYTYFPEHSQPTIKLTNLDDRGLQFLVDLWYNNSHNRFTVTFNGYDSENTWNKYVDETGDEICILGATMSSLAREGWPNNKVQLYFWIYSEDYGLVLE